MTYAQSVIHEAFPPVLNMGLESSSTALPLYSIPISNINDCSIIGTYLMIQLGFLCSRSFTLEYSIGTYVTSASYQNWLLIMNSFAFIAQVLHGLHMEYFLLLFYYCIRMRVPVLSNSLRLRSDTLCLTWNIYYYYFIII